MSIGRRSGAVGDLEAGLVVASRWVEEGVILIFGGELAAELYGPLFGFPGPFGLNICPTSSGFAREIAGNRFTQIIDRLLGEIMNTAPLI
jgi:hypothetical protein